MGNASGLAYDIAEPVSYNSITKWQLNDATKKVEKADDNKEPVSIFRLPVKTSSSDEVTFAQRNVQKLRTLRHPNVLTFIESAEVDDAIVLVTEAVLPLETWLENVVRREDDGVVEQDTTQAQELIWGFKCVLAALNFLHSTGNLLHGNLGLHSIFITPGGDWKLGGMELAVKLSSPEEVTFFTQHHSRLDRYYCSPERQRLSPSSSTSEIAEILTAKLPPYYLDMFSLAQCIMKSFMILKIEPPRSINKYISAMLHTDTKRRPTAQKLSQSAMFNSEHITFLDELASLKLKAPKEFIEAVNKMGEKLTGLTRSVCAYKILPSAAKIMQIAVNDFPQRDAREGCRQVSLSLLAELASLQKIDEAVFHKSCVPVLIQLWAMGDRTLRTSMLGALKHLAPLMPSQVVNKYVFDNMVAGFSDSNPKLREHTLMNLIYIVDKLDESVLQDRLVRVIVNLQNDVEPSIRTNTTIFIGKIASRMKDSVRARVLANSLLKAMKDHFKHCRIAGLRTATACLKLLDIHVIAGKILPQAGILCVDKSSEVRTLALTLVDNCLKALQAFHEKASTKDTEQKIDQKEKPIESTGGIGEIGHKPSDSSAWSSWSVLHGLSKTIESAALGSTTVAPSESSNELKDSKATLPKDRRESSEISVGIVSDLQSMEENATQQESEIIGNMNSSNPGWDNDLDLDDLNFDDDDDNESTPAEISDALSLGLTDSIMRVPSAAERSRSDHSDSIRITPSTDTVATVNINKKKKTVTNSRENSKKAQKPLVQKLAVSEGDTDNWDDF